MEEEPAGERPTPEEEEATPGEPMARDPFSSRGRGVGRAEEAAEPADGDRSASEEGEKREEADQEVAL